ncbi:hypothetical protein DPMN_017204 [Dreissena polymorpha]|uniref:Uncharacterized protein n=1 Tax=Dreissena polymorpha TaxID=45954 RepID=A0A9D4NG15_DREPO|nr:hypothetical protein DPMN_017204 [Dreissena polymorpha]
MRMHANVTNSTTSRKLTTSLHEYSTSPVEAVLDILLSVAFISVGTYLDDFAQDLYPTSPVEDSSNILPSVAPLSAGTTIDAFERDLHFKHRMKKIIIRGIATFSSKLDMRRRANAKTVVIVLQVVWIMRKTPINATEFEFCGSDAEKIVRKTANAKKTEME